MSMISQPILSHHRKVTPSQPGTLKVHFATDRLMKILTFL